MIYTYCHPSVRVGQGSAKRLHIHTRTTQITIHEQSPHRRLIPEANDKTCVRYKN